MSQKVAGQSMHFVIVAREAETSEKVKSGTTVSKSEKWPKGWPNGPVPRELFDDETVTGF
jgi:hypothetical protein